MIQKKFWLNYKECCRSDTFDKITLVWAKLQRKQRSKNENNLTEAHVVTKDLDERDNMKNHTKIFAVSIKLYNR